MTISIRIQISLLCKFKQYFSTQANSNFQQDWFLNTQRYQKLKHSQYQPLIHQESKYNITVKCKDANGASVLESALKNKFNNKINVKSVAQKKPTIKIVRLFIQNLTRLLPLNKFSSKTIGLTHIRLHIWLSNWRQLC